MTITEEIAVYLDGLLKTDPKTVQALFDHRVECGASLMDDEHVVVLADPGKVPVVGTLGILNGLISSVLGDPDKVIAAHYQPDGRLYRIASVYKDSRLAVSKIT